MIPYDGWNLCITLPVRLLHGTSNDYSSRLFENECITKMNACYTMMLYTMLE